MQRSATTQTGFWLRLFGTTRGSHCGDEAGEHVMAVTRSEDRSAGTCRRRTFHDRRRCHSADNPCACIRDLPTLGGRNVDCVLFAVGYDRTSGQSIRPGVCRRSAKRAGRSAGECRAIHLHQHDRRLRAGQMANGSTNKRRPTRAATAAGHRLRPSRCWPHILWERTPSFCGLPAFMDPGAFHLSTNFAPANRFPHRPPVT